MARRLPLLLLVAAAAAFVLIELDPGGRGGRGTRKVYEPEEAAAAPVAGVPEPPQEPSPAANVRVRVTCGGAPVAGARLLLFGPRRTVPTFAVEPPAAEALTGADGTWEFRGVEEGRILAEKEGYASACAVCDESVEIELARAAPRRILVLDPWGRPLPAAEAFVVEDLEVLRRIAADGEGRIAAPEGVRLAIRAPGYRIDRLMEDERPERVTLEPGVAIAGTVVDEEGRPVSGARVDCDLVEVTDSEGRFRIDGMVPEPVILCVDAEGYVNLYLQAFGGEEDLRLVLLRSAGIEGRILLPDGEPAAGAEVRLGGATCATADEAGRFRIDALDPGAVDLNFSCAVKEREFRTRTTLLLAPGERRCGVEFRLEPALSFVLVRVNGAEGETLVWAKAEFRGIEWEARKVPLGPGGETLLRVGAPPGTLVRVSVHDRFHGLERDVPSASNPEDALVDFDFGLRRQARILLLDAEGSPIAEPANPRIQLSEALGDTLESGSDLQLDLPARPFTLTAGADGYVSETIPSWMPDENSPTIFRLVRAGTVKGRLLPPPGGPALKKLDLSAWSGAWYPVSWDDRGNFVVENAPPGTLEIYCGGDDYLTVRFAVAEIRAAHSTDLGEFRLSPRIDHASIVVDREGRPLGGARIRAYCPSGDDFEEKEFATTGSDGRFRLSIPRGCDCRILVVRRNHGATVVRPDDLGRPVVLGPEGRLRVRGSRAAPTVRLRFERQPFLWDESAEEPSEDPDERIDLFENLPPGRHTIVWWQEGAERTRPAEIRAGETTEVDLR